MADAAPNWTRHVKDLSFEDLELMRDRFEALLAQPGWDELMRLIDQERAMVDAKLDHGDEPLSQAQYALLHGQRAGLAAPVAAIQAAMKRYVERRAQLEQPAGAGGR
jgi:hypothetical protein